MRKKVLCNKKLFKNDIKNLISWFLNNYGSIRVNKLLDKLKNIGFNKATEFGISLGIEDLKTTKLKKNILKISEENVKKQSEKLIIGKINIIEYSDKKNDIWNKTNNMLTAEITKNFEQTNSLNPAYMMIISGARGNLSQIKQLVGMRGLMADAEGKIINTPIKKNLKEGIHLHEYFISCYGARKGIIDTALKTANSGYLTRKLIYTTQQQIIKKTNCYTKYKILIRNLKNNKKYYQTLSKNLLGRVIAKNTIFKIEENNVLLSEGQDICRYILKKLSLCKKIYIRTPLTCLMNTGVCQLCYGWNLGNGRMAELGETIGIIAAQSIGEPGTQLTMRTFHTGGVINVKTKETILSPCEGIITYNSKGNLIETKYGEKGLIALSKFKISILPKKGNKLTINLPKNSIIVVRNKQIVKKKQIICETKTLKTKQKENSKQTNKILTIKSNVSGKIEKSEKKSIKLKSGNILNITKVLKLILNKSQKKIKESYKLKKRDTNNKNYEKQNKIQNANLKIYCRKNLIKKKRKNLLNKNEKIYIVNKKDLKTKLIFLNKLKSKIVLEKKGKETLRTTKITKYKYKEKSTELVISQIQERSFNLITLQKTNLYNLNKNEISYTEGTNLIKKQQPIGNIRYKINKIKDIVEGLPKIQQILESNKSQKLNEKLKKLFLSFKKKYTNKIATKKSFSLMQIYLLKKIKDVYSNQGINVNEKHFEILIKQMTCKVLIRKTGNSQFLNSEIVHFNKVEKINKNLKKKAKYEPIIVGISKLVKLNDGFLSSASFQETTNIISKSAIEGRIDWLNGLKENIILGNIIPAGTGNFNKSKQTN